MLLTPPVLRKQQLYFVLIYQIRNATVGFLVPLRAAGSESVSSLILFIFLNLNKLKLSFVIVYYINKKGEMVCNIQSIMIIGNFG